LTNIPLPYFFSNDHNFIPSTLEELEYYSDIYYSDEPVEPHLLFTVRINQLVTYNAYE